MSTPSYQPVTEAIVGELAGIVGQDNIIRDDPERLEPYGHDEIPDRRYAHLPEIVVKPRTAAEIAQIMRLANRELIPVTPRGAGSGLSGGAVPIYGGILLSNERQNRILEIDQENMMVVVEPGVVTAEINQALEGTGLFYAGYPMSLETCTIGGNVAENAGGGKAVKYGVTGRYVLGMEVVTPLGQIVRFGGKLIKDVTGYNLAQLMVGSEGTLGVFTEITLRLSPSPRRSVDLLAFYTDVDTAIGAVPEIMRTSGITPTAIEFMDDESFLQTCRHLNESFAPVDPGAVLLITVDGNDSQEIENAYLSVGDQCVNAGAFEVFVADNTPASERVWKVRRNIAETYALVSSDQANEDLVVPPAAIPDLVTGMKAIAARFTVAIPAYGHAGDGNIHTRVVKPPEWSSERWETTLSEILTELYDLTARLGGRISGEHGVGHKRKRYVGQFLSPEYLDVARAVKSAFDPNAILNPGKIFDL